MQIYKVKPLESLIGAFCTLFLTNINYKNQGYEEFESSAKIVFTPYTVTQMSTYGSATSATGTNADGTNTFTIDMRAVLGTGYANYTTDHFSNFTCSSVYVTGSGSGYPSGFHNYGYRYHTYEPSSGKLYVYIYGHTGNTEYISTVRMTINYTIIQLAQ